MENAFDSRKYRRQNQKYGVPIRWWKALPCECRDPVSGASGVDESGAECELCIGNSGLRYIEQAIPNSVFDGQPCRALVFRTQFEMHDAEFGQIPQGSTGISVLFDELALARGDRVMPLDGQFRAIAREVLTRGAGDLTALSKSPVLAVSLLTANGVIYALGRDFAIRENADGIEWLTGPGSMRPDAGERVSIEYAVRPIYTLLDGPNAARQESSDGGALPYEFVLNK